MRIAEGIRKVQKGGFAFQTDVASSYKLILVSFYFLIYHICVDTFLFIK